ncbi:MAG TPA: hypothetical protein VKN82_04050 [Desulfohalobiaceae bacterium]|nr:hypothetical protein [Desulfohalobiaceae bacterium]
MQTSTIRISAASHQLLKEVAQIEDSPMQLILEKAIERYRRELILHKTNQAYAALREDKDSWNEELRERDSWDQTLDDDLHGDD